ncbi:MAG: class I SAM-dependent methyltransferase [Infirmifilum sp.]|uniref:class I SAM-dependent methyltransferase n=1 Tax=Infirmifilum uzonense TaxID=1550241 RepID=UPI000A88EAF3|nr:class I SAM-dependent methyltransferase [Infirmifilum uzonense]
MSLSYDDLAPLYDELYGEEQGRKNFIAYGFLEGSKKILDVGCGTGILGEMLKKAEYYLCLDLSKGMLRIFKGKNHRVISDALRADAKILPIRDNAFEAAACITVLHEVPEAIREIHRVLKPAGIAVISIKKKLTKIVSLEGFSIQKLIESAGDEIFVVTAVKQMPSHHSSE